MADEDDVKEELPDAGNDREDEQGQPVSSDDSEGEDGGADETEELDEDEEPEEIDAAPKGRAQSRIRTLSQTAREATERAAAAERKAQELEERLGRLERPAPVQEKEPTPEEMALWSTDQIVDYKLSRATRDLGNRVQQLQFQTWDTGDKSGWAGYCATDQRAARMSNDVEKRLQEYRSRGIMNLTRGDVYLRIVGEKVVQQGSKAATTQRQEGKRRIARQTTNSGSPKGDQASTRRGELSAKDARDKRLREGGFIV